MPTDLPANASPPTEDRAPRESVLLSAEISGFSGGEPTRHRIRDLSITGARIDGASTLRAGATVLVSVGILEAIGATVIWVRDQVAGLKFAEPIDPAAARSRTVLPSPAHGAAYRKPAILAATPKHGAAAARAEWA